MPLEDDTADTASAIEVIGINHGSRMSTRCDIDSCKQLGGVIDTTTSHFECDSCQSCDGDVVRNQTYAFLALFNECGYARPATVGQLLAS